MCENGIVEPEPPDCTTAGRSAVEPNHASESSGLLRPPVRDALRRDPPSVENPFFWQTKAEVVKVIGDHGCSHLIASTVSCSHVYQMSNEQPHCGECSQCVDRRFGVLGAGLEEEDPEAKIRLRLLVDEWKAGEPRTLAESYIRFAVDTRNASPRPSMRGSQGRCPGPSSRCPEIEIANARPADRHAEAARSKRLLDPGTGGPLGTRVACWTDPFRPIACFGWRSPRTISCARRLKRIQILPVSFGQRRERLASQGRPGGT